MLTFTSTQSARPDFTGFPKKKTGGRDSELKGFNAMRDAEGHRDNGFERKVKSGWRD